jgi:carboxymethylenebutenolidase
MVSNWAAIAPIPPARRRRPSSVIQEIFGVNHHIRSVCDRLAAEGYVAIAPSIFDRIQPDFQCGYSPDEIATARKFIANPDWAGDAARYPGRDRCR